MSEPVERISFSNKIRADLLRELRHLAIDERRTIVSLVEESFEMILEKYRRDRPIVEKKRKK